MSIHWSSNDSGDLCSMEQRSVNSIVYTSKSGVSPALMIDNEL